MLQINPEIVLLKARLQSSLTLWFILFVSAAAVIVSRSNQGQAPIFSPILLIPFVTFSMIQVKSLFDVYWHSRKFYMQRLERVQLGDSNLLAVEQPLPLKQPLPLFLFVSWRTRASFYISGYLSAGLIMLTLFLPFVFLLSPPEFFNGLLQRLTFGFIGTPIIIVLLTLWSKRKPSQKVQEEQEEANEEDALSEDDEEDDAPKDWFSLLNEQFVNVDDESLTMYAFGKGHIDIPWEEAKLFCIVSGGNGPKSQRTYALVSETSCAKWLDAPSQSFWPFRRYRPWLADAQHQQKMQELLQFIVTKTGLPLYDLR